jgi:hypothetical protein
MVQLPFHALKQPMHSSKTQTAQDRAGAGQASMQKQHHHHHHHHQQYITGLVHLVLNTSTALNTSNKGPQLVYLRTCLTLNPTKSKQPLQTASQTETRVGIKCNQCRASKGGKRSINVYKEC